MNPNPRGDAAYRSAQFLARVLWRAVSRLEVVGADNVPRSGPFILICNHQSNLDPILIQAVCPRALHAMAKSSQFGVPVVGAIIRRLLSFPVRRYQTDPQAVRIVLRRLRHGQAVAIYIEGERSWDGRLQPPRLGTVRLILKAGVPVVPCTIAGSYEAWPRWHRSIRPHPIRIAFGPALHFPRVDRKADREPLVHATAHTLMATLALQLGAPARTDEPAPLQVAS